MDCVDFSPREVIDTFRFIEPVNRWFGGHRPLISLFRRERRTWAGGRTYRILDVGCGSGDIPIALARWGRRRGCQLRIEAVDSHPATVKLAQQNCRDYPEISVSQRNVFDLEQAHSDYVVASMFLHHFPDDEIVAVLSHLLKLCTRKVIVNDLRRDPLAYAGTWLFSLLTSPVFRHDARLSVRRGFTVEELRSLALPGFLYNVQLETHFFYRFLLVLSKEETA
jgi:2-polyprenyl-3-methyl-5-hydroxy-6-metoxy-1,4-benzoquinol methylase